MGARLIEVTIRLMAPLKQEEGAAENLGFGGTILKNVNIGLEQIVISAKSAATPTTQYRYAATPL